MLAILNGCWSKPPDKPSANGYSDSGVVTLHDGDNYIIRSGNVEVHAVCRYTLHNTKGQDKAIDLACFFKALPVGQEIKVKRGEGDWLFANWEEGSTQWHMGLNVEKEQLR
jgi:hypothetical protein